VVLVLTKGVRTQDSDERHARNLSAIFIQISRNYRNYLLSVHLRKVHWLHTSSPWAPNSACKVPAKHRRAVLEAL